MSLSNTYDSQNASQVQSPSSIQQLTQEVVIQNGNVSNRQLTYPQIRGVIQIFNHHFPKNGKRMSKDERARRWLTYKNKIFRDYGRVITGKLDSEKAYVKRYSKPLDFLKYKLKRSTNLNVEDLRNEADKEYYFEIGGLEDVEALKAQTYDINYDSVQQISNNFENYNNSRRRKRRRIKVNDNSLNQNHNHNRPVNNNENQVAEIQESNQRIIVNRLNVSAVEHVPPPLQNNNHNNRQRTRPKSENGDKLDEALVNLHDKLDVFEQEVLDKKKIEMYEITKQKWTAIKNSMESHFINDAQLIGAIPGIENQDAIAFDCWLNKYKHIIKDDREIRGNVELLMDQICILKDDMTEWNNFLTKWKLHRIFYDDNFQIVWNKIKDQLNIKNHAQYKLASTEPDSDFEIDEKKDD